MVFSDGQSTATFPNTSDPAGSPAHTRIEVDTYEAGLSLPPLTYRLVSVPVELANPVATAVLEDDYGPYNPDQWRLFRWNPARGAYDEGSEIPAGFTPGTAFWLNTRAGLPFDVEGGRSVDGADSASVTLEPGWNQIATPFAFSIAWENVRGSSEAETPVAYDGEYRYGQDILMPWQGYFVYNSTPNPVTLSFPPAEASAAAAKNRGVPAAMLAASYTMQFKAAVPGTVLRDSENYLGFAVGASEGRDRLDFAEAPGIGAHLRVSVVEGEERLAGSFRPEGGEGQSWVVEVALERLAEALPTQKQVQVVLQEQGERPAGFEIYVLDDDLGRRVTVEQGAFTVELSPPQPVRRLRVIVGTAAYVEAVRGEVMVESLEDALLGNYPNPFNPVTRIQYQLSQRRQVELTIFDVLGRRVQVLERGEREAGRHEVAWDGQDRYGRLVASGVYVYRLEAEGFRAVRTMMLMR